MNLFSSERLPAPMHGADADKREFETFAQAQDPLDIEAATWVARKRNGMAPEGEAELQTWLDADPRHAAAFEDMDATFGDVQQLPDGDVALLKASLPKHAQGVATPLQSAVPTPALAPPRRLPAAPSSPGRING
ncbi:MAG: FecR/PupR family sigma factor regulator [Synechococcaceae cyanobacterium SM1_2_3]|nr:FecR/PupR family sigma factor regulator [Synechococcaceae cyanobacterium SM1_2_3]